MVPIGAYKIYSSPQIKDLGSDNSYNDKDRKMFAQASDEEVAKEMGLPIGEYHKILQDTNSAQLLSIDQPDHEELSEDRMVSNFSTPLQQLADHDFQNQLASEIENLPEKEKLVMALYYDEELNLKEIGQVLDVSESRVSQIHSQAIKRIRSRMTEWI